MDCIASQRLAHAVNGATSGGNHRDIRVENGQPLGPTLFDKGFSRRRDQYALIAEGSSEARRSFPSGHSSCAAAAAMAASPRDTKPAPLVQLDDDLLLIIAQRALAAGRVVVVARGVELMFLGNPASH